MIGNTQTQLISLTTAAIAGLPVTQTGNVLFNSTTGLPVVCTGAAYKSVPYTDGTGASGTWGISITGDAGTLDGLDSTAFALTGHTHAAAGITVGTSAITGGTNTRILYDNAGVLGEYTLTGTGTVAVMQTSPTLITPNIGVATGTSLTCPTLYGGSAANDDITISGTSHATTTTSYVILQSNGGFVGVGTTTPAATIHAKSSDDAIIRAESIGSTKEAAFGIYNDNGVYGALEVFGSAFANASLRNAVSFTCGGAAATKFVFFTYQNSSPISFEIPLGTEQFRISSSGAAVTSSSASALAVGRLGATTPALKINSATASCVTGIEITAAASANVSLTAIGATNISMNLVAAGTGGIVIPSPAVAGGSVALTVTPGAHTALTAEKQDIVLTAHIVTLTDGTTIALARSAVFNGTTFNGVAGGGSEIVTTAITQEIALPVQGTNLTITNAPIALRSLGNVVIGNVLTPAAGPTNSLFIASGTAPTAVAADSAVLYVADIAAGNAAVHAMTEGGVAIKLFQGAAISDASGGAIIDAEARTALNALLARMRANNLIAT